MTRTDAQIKTMLLEGIRPDGKFLSGVMPYWIYHNLTPTDADAIVSYLRTVPGVERTTPPNEPPFDNVPVATQPIDDNAIPPARGDGTGFDSPARGRYLATLACMDCHTPENPPGAPSPIDLARAFQGGRAFPAALVGIPSPPFPEVIFSRNLGVPLDRFRDPGATLRITPGHPDASGIYLRMRARGDARQMPPLATERADDDGSALVRLDRRLVAAHK